VEKKKTGLEVEADSICLKKNRRHFWINSIAYGLILEQSESLKNHVPYEKLVTVLETLAKAMQVHLGISRVNSRANQTNE
jgi:hypothetical protein